MRRIARAVAFTSLLAAVLPAGCDSSSPTVATIDVRSSAFEPGGSIPAKYARHGPGEDVSPPLEWTGVPKTAAQLVVICDDPDASGFVHWLAYGIAADARSLAENAVGGFIEGKNGFGEIGYSGPRPRRGDGPHHYHFRVYALAEPLAATAGLGKPELLEAMRGKILAQGALVGIYERK